MLAITADGWLALLLGTAALGTKLVGWSSLRSSRSPGRPAVGSRRATPTAVSALAQSGEIHARTILAHLADRLPTWSPGLPAVARIRPLPEGPIRVRQPSLADTARAHASPCAARRLATTLRHEMVQTLATVLLVAVWLQICLTGGATPLRCFVAVAGAIALAAADGTDRGRTAQTGATGTGRRPHRAASGRVS